MESRVLTILLLIVIGVLAYFFINEKWLNPTVEVREITVPDTVYVEVPFEVEIPSEEVQIVPRVITMWKTETVPVEKVEVVYDTVRVYTEEQSPISYHSSFLTQYSYAPKFLGMELYNNKLTFTGMMPTGEVRSIEYGQISPESRYLLDPDGRGWVAMREEQRRRIRMFGFSFPRPTLTFSHSVSAGSLWRVQGAGFQQDLYLNYTPTLHLNPNIALEAGVWISNRPFVSTGIKYEF